MCPTDNATDKLPLVYLARHGETDWTITGRHTGLTDLPLTERGERNARRLRDRLRGIAFERVFTSPLRRALRTCEIAGYGDVAQLDDDLVEWNYGAYEGTTTAEIRQQRPGWEIFRDGCPAGESLSDVVTRANRIVDRLRESEVDQLIVSHSHFLCVFAACWLDLQPEAGRCFYLGTAALSILGYHRSVDNPVIRLWNDCGCAGE
jgi:broad specificity phosphatase PhoE